MELTMAERLLLLNVLPEKGDITTIRVLHDLQQSLGPTSEEQEEFGFFADEEKPGMIFWNTELPQEKEIEISKAASKLIKDRLLGVSEKGEVTVDLIPLFDKFVIEEDEDG